jgi:integrase
MYESDCEKENLTPPEILERAATTTSSLLPKKSVKTYERCYSEFMAWRAKNKVGNFSENVVVVYFDELSTKLKPPSLWTHYSILKSTLSLKHQVDISKFFKLHALLKRKSEGYQPKKAKTFSPNEIKQFIGEAPDMKYLLLKVACIFGIMGACRRHELHKLEIDDVNEFGSTQGSAILVTIRDTKTHQTRKFTVTGKYYDICKKYMNLRPQNCATKNFFVNYINGKCTIQNVGINKFGNMGKEIATYLNLPNAQLYTGHCFRRSSATILVDAGGDITSLKRHGGWKSTTVAESYVDESIQNKTNIANQILNSIEYSETSNLININTPSASTNTGTQHLAKASEINFNNCTIHNIIINENK